MAIKWVKYKLLEFGSGFMTPNEVFEGGNVWENNSNIGDMILYGKANIENGILPEGVIEIISNQDIKNNNKNKKNNALKKYKQSMYKQQTDPIFIEALREKLEGDDTKWIIYLDKFDKIHKLTEIPKDK